jgi:hypothetical protein
VEFQTTRFEVARRELNEIDALDGEKVVQTEIRTAKRVTVLSKDRTMEIRWAGDIDGDGKLDLITEENVEATIQVHLFLSSSAGRDGVAREVATLNYGGC